MATVLTPNKSFNGERYGVTFVNGAGQTKDPVKLDWFKKRGYKVVTKKKDANVEPTPEVETAVESEEESDLQLVSEGMEEPLGEDDEKPERVVKHKAPKKKKLRKSSIR